MSDDNRLIWVQHPDGTTTPVSAGDDVLIHRLFQIGWNDNFLERCTPEQINALMTVGHYMHREEKIESPAPEWIVGWLYGLQMGHDYAIRFGPLDCQNQESRIRLRNSEVRELRALLESARRRDDTSLTGYLIRQLERFVPICSNPVSEDPDVGLDDTCPNCGQDHTLDWVLAEENADDR